MSFDNFPIDFPHITKASRELLFEPLGVPPDMRSIGQKVADAFALSRGDFDAIRPREWRHVPYALWMADGFGLVSNRSAVDRYLEVELPRALTDSRRPLKWGRPLVFVYIEKFNPADLFFQRLSKHTKEFFDSPKIVQNSDIVGLVRDLDLFDVERGPSRTADAIATSRRSFSEWVKLHGLWPSFGTSPFAEASFNAFLKVRDPLDQVRRESEFVGVALGWAVNESDQFRYPASRIKLAEALLLPWRQTMPAEPLQNRIIAFLLKHYADPRIGKNLWQGVSLEAQQVFNKWIAGRTLDLFFRILKETADSIWEYRQKFWTAYYRAGYLDEVWLALGPDATTALRKLDDTKSLKAAKLLDCLKNQSVLLIRIGPIIFCEWSHDGRLRAQRIDARGAPVMYRSYYEAEALRFHSLDFNDGQTQDPGLVHFSSQKGGWQARARAFIRLHTGIQMSLSEVTL